MKTNVLEMTTHLKDLEFELAYLALLTREGLKPLSRWEKDSSPAIESALKGLGLKTVKASRRVNLGKPLNELLFSVSEASLDLYMKRFDGTSIDHQPDAVRFQGRLFGYPSCCVESFITQGYTRNALRRRDQRILFHWACPHCTISPALLPDYRRVHAACSLGRRGGIGTAFPGVSRAMLARHCQNAIAMAASLAAMGGNPALVRAADSASVSPDPHQAYSLLGVELAAFGLDHFVAEPEGTDSDNDGLRNWEEPDSNLDPEKPDTDGDGKYDGVELARELRAALDALPRQPQLDRPYVIEHPMNGIEACPRCGEFVVMDLWEVTNPVTGDTITVPSMAHHFLEHGGLGWQGGRLLGGEGRTDPRHLLAVITGKPNRHLRVVKPDLDVDWLSDTEETSLHKDPTNKDENGNATADGLDLARTTACEIAGLPSKPETNRVYRIEFPLKGLEQCDICGASVNMGHVTLCNPMAQLYIKLPYINLHFFEHDSFSFAGNIHGEGRTGLKLLMDVLHSKGPSHRLDVSGDTDADGVLDGDERHFGTDPSAADSNQDGIPDGFALARALWSGIGSLPRFDTAPFSPPKDSTYAVDHLLRGLVACPICGTMVNMGWLEVVNPNEHLSMDIPYLHLHFLEQGSFTISNSEHLDPVRLSALLRLPVEIAANNGLITLRWTGLTQHTYRVFSAATEAGPWTLEASLDGNGTELVYTENQPKGLGQKIYMVTAAKN